MKYGILFDLDGTLVDSLQGIAASLNHALADSGFPTHSEDAVRGFIGNGSRNLIMRSCPVGSGEDVIDTVEQAFKAHYDRAWPSGTHPYPGIAELLDFLQSSGHTLAVLSNKPHPFTAAIVREIFPAIHFAAVLGQRPGIPHKPDPTGALEISNTIGIPAARCVLIGDSTMDIDTAKNAGMSSIAVTWGFHDRARLLAAGADDIADTPAELREHFTP